jgi:hypothetical protein
VRSGGAYCGSERSSPSSDNGLHGDDSDQNSFASPALVQPRQSAHRHRPIRWRADRRRASSERGRRATIDADGAIHAKYGWWRNGLAKIKITGRRLDGIAPPLRADVPSGYGSGFQATMVVFPTTGCWRVTGTFLGAKLTFTALVTRSPLGP